MAKADDHYAKVAEALIEKLEEGTAPWQQPWDTGGYGSLPMNPTTGNRYRGGNAVQLMMHGYGDPRWMTYRQAQQADAQVRKGERGTPIIYWKTEEEPAVRGEDGKPVQGKDGNPLKEKVHLERPRSFISYVFNAEQIEGLPPLVADKERTWADVQRAEKILEASGAKVVHRAQGNAFYKPNEDAIYLPEKQQFSSEEGYYSTALHELAHWTGHESRLHREFGPFGSVTYAKEELRAEIGSMMLTGELGVGQSIDDHAAYVQSWIKILRDDPRELFRAAADAEKIKDYVMGFEHTQEIRQSHESVIESTPFMDALEPPVERVAMREPLAEVSPAHAVETANNDRLYLNVSFKEKEEAKALGAKWDRQEKSWYIPADADTTPFANWLKKEEETMHAPEPEAIQQRRDSERLYLAVPYVERKEAKAAGAKWDSIAQSWYAGPEADMERLKKWLPENVRTEQLPAMTPREEFAEALRGIGCVVEGTHPIMDGAAHRIKTEGDRQEAYSEFYVAHLDGRPAGYMKNNRTGEELRWKTQGAFVSQQEKAAFHAECARKRQERAKEQVLEQEKTAQRVAGQLSRMKQAVPTPYLDKKGLAPRRGVFLAEDGKTTCIPAVDADGKLWSMQYIQEDGTKRFAKNGRKEGCFHPVGGMDALRTAPAIVIAEGYATAGSISDAIGHATVAAFDSGNLMAVATALKDKYPDKAVLVAGDDDRHLLNHPQVRANPGREKAEKAAQAVGGKAVFPTFAPGEREKDMAGFTDFNDLARKSKLGMAAVARQLKPAIEKAIKEKAVELEKNKQLVHSRSEGISR